MSIRGRASRKREDRHDEGGDGDPERDDGGRHREQITTSFLPEGREDRLEKREVDAVRVVTSLRREQHLPGRPRLRGRRVLRIEVVVEPAEDGLRVRAEARRNRRKVDRDEDVRGALAARDRALEVAAVAAMYLPKEFEYLSAVALSEIASVLRVGAHAVDIGLRRGQIRDKSRSLRARFDHRWTLERKCPRTRQPRDLRGFQW
jgi:hypothetical protein